MLFKKLPSLMLFLLLFLIAPVSPSLASLATLCASLSPASCALGIAAGKSMLCCSRGIFGAANARLGLAFRALRSALAAMRRCFLDLAVEKVSRTRTYHKLYFFIDCFNNGDNPQEVRCADANLDSKARVRTERIALLYPFLRVFLLVQQPPKPIRIFMVFFRNRRLFTLNISKPP